VSSLRILIRCSVVLLAAYAAAGNPQANDAQKANQAASATSSPNANLAQLFQRGQEALSRGQLDEAEHAFRQILAADPNSGGAFANLGVVYMRRKQWTKALENLHQAEHRLPQVAGIRLTIGLAYYRQNEFLKATGPFESVVRDQPDALQPRYLLGLCYFFADRWADAAATLEPLWAQESMRFPYLYVLSNAAHRAHQKQLDDRATEQLIKIGDGSPEYHLFVGKYRLNLEQYDQALTEFQAAAEGNPKLPFVHFNLGLTYMKKQDYERARDEFLKDAQAEPDLALNYDELGDVYSLLQHDADAEKSYREALHRDSHLENSHVGLAKIYLRGEKYSLALAEVDAAVKLDPGRTDIHYLRGQALMHLGRKEEGRKELEAAVRIDNEHRAAREKEIDEKSSDAGTVPSPELLQDPQ
jgi:tetratricopeptide (TPR) repeat protein